MSDDNILEKLSDLEHKQWCSWSESISKDISLLLAILDKFDNDSQLNEEDKIIIRNLKQKLSRWDDLRVPYFDLSEDEKEKDREYARQILSIFND